jgi:putative ABC transport system permease protein
MRSALYPKIAVDGIRKNSKLYVPYIATCILMVAVFYIMHTLGFSDMLSNFMGAATAKDILELSAFVQERVAEKFGIQLKREIILLGEF